MGPEIAIDSRVTAAQHSTSTLPPLAALFVIYFDNKAGYTISWKEAAQGVLLDGVEYKSLPSGLHNIKEDLVYFVHGAYAGVSAFINQPAAEEERNAMMLSVGILVPLSSGRLGRCWRHAENLKQLAKSVVNCKNLAQDPSQHRALSEYYHAHKIPNSTTTPPLSPIDSPSSLRYRPSPSKAYKPVTMLEGAQARARTRSISDATVMGIGAAQISTLSPHHPALSLMEFLDTFGPLVFPLYRAAITRKRILLITQAPVEVACNFVYDISILSTIPLSVSSIVTTSDAEPRLRPLFSVGLRDIPFLEEQSQRRRNSTVPDGRALSDSDIEAQIYGSWVASTTDGVFYVKSSLYDVVVTLPPPHAKNATKKSWPKMECPAGVEMKATQRDLRRYRKLRRGLQRYSTQGNASSSRSHDLGYQATAAEEEAVCERASWAELAYNGFLWWASAGEKRQDNTSEEDAADTVHPAQGHPVSGEGDLSSSGATHLYDEARPLLDGDSDGEDDDDEHEGSFPIPANEPDSPSRDQGGTTKPETMEMDIIAYFHRLTARIFGGMAESIGSGAGEYSENGTGGGGENHDEYHHHVQRRELLEGSRRRGRRRVETWFTREEMANMGLDQWSEGDERFLVEMGRTWWRREVAVERGGLCGCCC